MKPYIYQQIKERVTMTEVLEHYGFKVNKGFTSCPFHSEKTSSLKVYHDNFYCYGCGKAGDLIKFVSLLLNVENHEAARILNDEFSLGLDIDGETNSEVAKQYEQQKREREELQAYVATASTILSTYHRFLFQQQQHPNENSPLFFLSLRDLSRVEFLIQCLSENPAEFKKSYTNDVIKIARFLNKINAQCE